MCFLAIGNAGTYKSSCRVVKLGYENGKVERLENLLQERY